MPDITTPEATTFTVRLTGWGSWEDLHLSIKALLFGHMVKLATPVLQEYRSDLYHDALWLHTSVTGPIEFEWLIRPSGTNLQDAARVGVKIGAGQTAQFWRITLFEVKGDWQATFTRIPLDEVPAP
jgi:hypothetical protein